MCAHCVNFFKSLICYFFLCLLFFCQFFFILCEKFVCTVNCCFRATKQLEDLDNERKSLIRQNKEKDAKLQGLDALLCIY